MSLDHTKKFITEKLQADADFRDRVVDFILYRNFLSNSDDQKNFGEVGELKRGQRDRNCYSDPKHDGNEISTADSQHGYEHWSG
ncbi:MAG: hypothetical protein ACOYOE_01025 [Chlorobium sp.]